MLSRLKNKWKVSWFQFTLIICTFASGGSISGLASKTLLGLIFQHKNFIYYILYVLLVSLLWAPVVLLVSIPLGQFTFFKNYIKKIGKRMFGK